MEIKNEEHAKGILEQLQEKTLPVQKRELRTTIDKLELNCMYYEQKGNERGVARTRQCIAILSAHLQDIE